MKDYLISGAVIAIVVFAVMFIAGKAGITQ
jgi:hypothetical protein